MVGGWGGGAQMLALPVNSQEYSLKMRINWPRWLIQRSEHLDPLFLGHCTIKLYIDRAQFYDTLYVVAELGPEKYSRLD